MNGLRSNKSSNRTVTHPGRAVLAIDGVLAGAESASSAAG